MGFYFLLLNFLCKAQGTPSPEVTGSLFAEFLKPLSLARLSILYQPTCVGLRYGLLWISLRIFSGKLNGSKSPQSLKILHHCLINHSSGFSNSNYLTVYTLHIRTRALIILFSQSPVSMHSMQNTVHRTKSTEIFCLSLLYALCCMFCVLRTLFRFKTSTRILTSYPSTTPLWPRLRSRLTRRGRT